MTTKPLICVVEDNESVRVSLELLIKTWGFGAKLFQSAEDLLANGGEERFDCLILDFNLPGIDALELISRLRDESRSAPTIVVSGTLDDIKSKLLHDSGVVAVLGKPVMGEQLLSVVEQAVQGS